MYSIGVVTLRDPLVFSHIVLKNMLGVRRAREIRDRVSRRMDLCERGIRTVLVGDIGEKGDSRESRAISGGKEDD